MTQQPLGSYRRSFIVREALRIAPARPNLASGVRAGLATTMPLVLASATGHAELVFASLAGFATVLADKGGSYRTRALTAGAMALFGALATLLGSLVGEHTLLAALLAFVVVWIGGFVRLFGAEATGVGTLTSVSLVLALARPVAGLHEAFLAFGGFLLGALWAALLSLVLWPLRPFRPVRLALRGVLAELASTADSLVDADVSHAAQIKRREQLGRAREAIETARRHLGRSRRGRPGPSQRGMQLVGLLEGGDQLFGALIALEDELTLTPTAAPRALRGLVNHAAQLIAATLRALGDALEDERRVSDDETRAREIAALRAEIEGDAQFAGAPLVRMLLVAIERLGRLSALTRGIDDPAEAARTSIAPPSELSTEASRWSLVRDHLTLDSAMFRHALRMAVSTTAALLVMHALEVEHGYWATLTCLVILQPHGAATWAKAVQRVLGTMLGALVAVAVASMVHGHQAVIAFVFVFIVAGMALLPLNYGAFSVFLTPAFVLLAELHQSAANLPWMRVVNTLIGATIALLGSRLLLPISEREQLRPLLDKAFAALSALLEVAAVPEPQPDHVRAARRQLGLSLLNAEASYQRLLTETGIGAAESEGLLTLLLYAHRLGAGLIALAVAAKSPPHAVLVRRREELAYGLALLRNTVASGQPPVGPESVRPPPPSEASRVDTLFEQLAVLRAAARRCPA